MSGLCRVGPTGHWPSAARVIGGGEIYRLFLPLAQRCEVTVVEADVPGDALAPELGEGWVVEENDWQTSESGLRYQFLSYRKVDG
ncbi:Dihydrofolate reductase DfrA [Mycobacteroides abscessus subsp. abscessus]|nr:Dihydrofolate reductase DfrA [Mycobacteroides abscessus subsp. abscessus]